VVEGRAVMGRTVVRRSIMRRSMVRRAIMRRSMVRRAIMVSRTMVRRLLRSLRRTMMFMVILGTKALKQLSTLRIKLIHSLAHPRIHIKVLIRLRNLGIDFLLDLLYFGQSGIEDVLGLRRDSVEGFGELFLGELDSLLCIVVEFGDCGQFVEKGWRGAGLNRHMLEFVELLVGQDEGSAEGS